MAGEKRSTWKIVLGIIVIIFIAIQFIPVGRTNPPVTSDIPAPPEVKSILHRACYDCHSNETDWPWYSHVAPSSWLVAHDVHEAREHMNWSQWDQYDADDREDFIKGIWKLVDKGEMPLWYYQIAHPESKLSEQDKMTIKNWSNTATVDSASASIGGHEENEETD